MFQAEVAFFNDLQREDRVQVGARPVRRAPLCVGDRLPNLAVPCYTVASAPTDRVANSSPDRVRCRCGANRGGGGSTPPATAFFFPQQVPAHQSDGPTRVESYRGSWSGP